MSSGELVEVEENLPAKKSIPKRTEDQEKEKWRTGLDSMQKRWTAILSQNMPQFPHDVKFSFGAKDSSEEVTCHKFVLSAASPVFEMLIKNAEELGKEVIELPRISATAFKNVIQNIYEGNVKKVEEDSLAQLFWGIQGKWTTSLNTEETCFPHNLTFLIGEAQEEFRCHKFVLSISSPIFEEMFCDDLHSSQSKSIEIVDISPIGFRNLLRHIHQDEQLVIADEDLVATMIAAHKCWIPELQQQCSGRLQNILSKENAINIFQQADLIQDTQLRDKAKTFLSQQFEEYFDTEHFLCYTDSNLCEFIKSDDLFVFSEIELFKSVIRWAENSCKKEKSVENVKEELDKVLHYIRLPTICLNDFLLTVEPSKYINTKEKLQLFKYLYNKKQKMYKNQTEMEMTFSTARRKCKIDFLTVNLFSDFAVNETAENNGQYEKSTKDGFVHYIKFHTVGGTMPLFLTGVGFAGHPNIPTEDVEICLKIYPESNITQVFEKSASFTVQANTIHTVDLQNSIQIACNEEYRLSFAILKGGVCQWKTQNPEIVVYNNQHCPSKSVKLNIKGLENATFYSLRFDHEE